MMETILYMCGGSGATVAIITVYGKLKAKGIELKAKSMDLALEERKQFVTELNDLRKEVNGLYRQLHDIIRENGDLRNKIADLERHVNHKTHKLTRLKQLVDDYKASNDHETLIHKVVELAA